QCDVLANELRDCLGEECLGWAGQILERYLASYTVSFTDISLVCDNAAVHLAAQQYCATTSGLDALCALFHQLPQATLSGANGPSSLMVLTLAAIVGLQV